jgi:peroxiredoxin
MSPARDFALGDEAPPLELADTEGRTQSLEAGDDSSATVVIWTCNHCPYALAWHDRLADVARDYAGRGVRFFAVNSNDADRYPADSLDAMRDRVAEEDWPFPYLHDSSQDAARAWGAETTPHVFALDAKRRLRYEGAPDPDYGDPDHEAVWLREALDHILAGEPPARPRTEPVGCSIKWKP